MKNQNNNSEEKTKEKILQERLKFLALKSETSGWIETIYKSRTDRLISENSKIWTTGRIFIPVSIGVFGVYATLEHPTLTQTYILAAISISLLLIWQAISFVHKNFQTVHSDWLERIEKVIEIESPIKEEGFLEKVFKLGKIRLALIVIVILLWAAIIITNSIYGTL